MRGEWAFNIIKNQHFNSLLDVGCGSSEVAQYFCKTKRVTAVDISLSKNILKNDNILSLRGDYNSLPFSAKFDVIWCSHILEHQLNVQSFLEKIFDDLEEDGILAVVVPCMKHNIVGGHVSLWNTGLLLYRLILAGFDCSRAIGKVEKNEINIIVRKKKSSFCKEQLLYDKGDVEFLNVFFPFNAYQNFCGDIDGFGNIDEFVKNTKESGKIVMAYASFFGDAIINYSNFFKRLNCDVFILNVSGKKHTDFKTTVVVEDGIKTIDEPKPTLQKIERIIEEEDVDIIVKHQDFRRFSREFTSFINNRNYFIEKYNLNKKCIDIFHTEGGFIRPGIAQFDHKGCNGDSSLADFTIHEIPNLTEEEEKELDKWVEAFHSRKIPKEYTKEDICKTLSIPLDNTVIFCPLQVDNDSVLRYYSGWCSSAIDFISVLEKIVNVINKNTDEKITLVFKKHPKQEFTISSKVFLPYCKSLVLESDHEINTGSLLKNSDAVFVVNSTAGCEALTWYQKVVCFGFAAWAKSGVVFHSREDHSVSEENILEYFNKFKKHKPNKKNIRKILHYIIFKDSWGGSLDTLRKVLNRKSTYHKI